MDVKICTPILNFDEVKATLKEAKEEEEEEEDARDSNGLILVVDLLVLTLVTHITPIPKFVTICTSHGRFRPRRRRVDTQAGMVLLQDDHSGRRLIINTTCLKLEACVEDNKIFPNPCRQCCFDKGINTGVCNLTGTGNTCKCTTPI